MPRPTQQITKRKSGDRLLGSSLRIVGIAIIRERINHNYKAAKITARSAGVLTFLRMASLAELTDPDENCCDLDMKTRFIAGAICSVVGILFSALSFISFMSSLKTFALVYTLGTLCSFGASFFFTGPKKHLKKLKERDHLISAAALLFCIIMVFVSAFALHSSVLAIIFVILQAISYAFFYITMFPGGMSAIKALVKTIF